MYVCMYMYVYIYIYEGLFLSMLGLALMVLPEVRGKWEELESLSEKRQQSLGLRSGGCFVATQATALEDPDKVEDRT